MIQNPKSQIEKQIDELRKNVAGAGTGKFLDAGHTSVAHNDVEHNTSTCKYDSISGYKNSSSGTSSTVNDIVYCGANTVIGEHNTLTGCSGMLVNGKENTVNGGWGIVFGDTNSITGVNSCILGGRNNDIGNIGCSAVTGYDMVLRNIGASGIFGKNHRVNGNTGNNLLVSGDGASVSGSGLMLVIGSGGNIFTVDSSGNVLAAGTYGTMGADYAEYFEWLDGNSDNEDRRGMLVSLVGDKIQLAHGDEFVGIISVNPSMVGNAAELHWYGKYKTDVYGHILTDEHGEKIISPEYDPDREYIPRSKRREWSVVGLVGRLIVRDNGKCAVGGYVSARNGTAVPTTRRTGIIVLKRVDKTHVEVLIK